MLKLLDFVYQNCLFHQFKVNDLLFVEYKCVADESRLKVWAHHNYFLYVISGKKVWQTKKRKYEVRKGQAIFVKKGANIVHQFFDRDFCSLIIFVPDQFIRDVISRNRLQANSNRLLQTEMSDTVLPLDMNQVLLSYFHSLFSFFQSEEPPPKNLLEIKFTELLLDIFSSGHNREICAYLMSLFQAHTVPLQKIMEDNFQFNMKLEEYAHLCGRSLTTFKRDFSKHYKVPPGKWLANKRMEYAKYLLETTDQNVNELAFECGFENPSHFVRVFREKYGMPPLQFKRSTLAI